MHLLVWVLLATVCTNFSDCEVKIFGIREVKNTTFEIISSENVSNPIQCARSCKSRMNCTAVVYDNEQGQCLTLNTSVHSKTSSVYSSPEWTFIQKYKYVCDEDWTMFASSCYIIPNTKLNWLKSSEFCSSIGGHLVTIGTEYEETFVIKLRNEAIGDSNFVWTGGRNVSTTGIWAWTWVTGEFWGYQNWGTDQPTGVNNLNELELCLDLFPINWDGFWNDRACYEIQHFVCEKRAFPIPDQE